MEELQRFGNSNAVQLNNFKRVIFGLAFPEKRDYDETLLMTYFNNERIEKNFAEFKKTHGGEAVFKHASMGHYANEIAVLMKSMRISEELDYAELTDEAKKAARKASEVEDPDARGPLGALRRGGSIKKRTKRNRRKNRSTRIKKNRRKSRT
jgi:hypothetical protein